MSMGLLRSGIKTLQKKNKGSLKIQAAPPVVLSGGFLVLILLGTVLLKLPYSTTTEITWLQSFFTATSAVTVTGLAVLNTGTDFTLFGQLVIALLIQVGGLGLMTFAVITLITLGGKIGFLHQTVAKEAFNQTDTSTLVSTAKAVVLFALLLEGVGMLILSVYWQGELGWSTALFHAFFYTISAFNNAGFALNADNLMPYVADPVINLTISFLFISGGLGFTVWMDLLRSRKWHKLSIYSRMMLSGTLCMNVLAFLLIYLLEHDNPGTLGNLDAAGQWLAAWFQAVTPRTAGFNTVDIGALRESTTVIMLGLMFVGGGSLSTASGIKVVTFMVVVLAAYSFIRRDHDVIVFKRKVPDQIVRKAFSLTVISIGIMWGSTFLLLMTESASLSDVLFEVISALGTVGLSKGLTADLSVWGQLVICALMFVGRLGPLLLAYLFASPRRKLLRYPEASIPIG